MITKDQTSLILNLLGAAHHNAALKNENVSSHLVLNAFRGSRNVTQAIIAGTACLGGDHAPLTKARNLIRRWRKTSEKDFGLYIKAYIINKKKVPGYGNSFWKDQIDPCFQKVFEMYQQVYGKKDNPVDDIWYHIEKAKQSCDRKFLIHPNAAIITAAIAELCELDDGMEVGIALQGRIPAWIKIMNTVKV